MKQPKELKVRDFTTGNKVKTKRLLSVKLLKPRRQTVIQTTIETPIFAIISIIVFIYLADSPHIGFTIAEILFVILLWPMVYCLSRWQEKCYLCEAGIVTCEDSIFNVRKKLFRWDSFRPYEINERNKEFKLEDSSGHTLMLQSKKHFKEAKQIFMNKIPVSGN